MFEAAKGVEVKNFIIAKVFELLPASQRPREDEIMKMRWILTWKVTEGGGTKAKARAVILGYLDPDYEHRPTASPTMTRTTRQLMLQICAQNSFKLQKGDVSGAFLQGRNLHRHMFCIPTPEICKALNIPEGMATRLTKACYGLVEAPLEWYLTVSAFLSDLGFRRLYSDPCAWVFYEKGRLVGIISGHVDDFLFGGSNDDPKWLELKRKIQERFTWTGWEEDDFIQCGVRIRQMHDHSFKLSQSAYIDQLREIPLTAERRKHRGEATSDRKKSLLRSALGGLNWAAQQTNMIHASAVSLLLSSVNTSTVQTLIETNKLIFKAKAQKDFELVIHAFSKDETLEAYSWVDAAHQN